MKVKSALFALTALVSGGNPINLPTLDAAAREIVAARPLRDLPEGARTVEQQRAVEDSDRIIERLSELALDQIAPDAVGRFGDLLAASQGLTMKFVGPVAHEFRIDKSAISTIMGPYGSAKTTTCFQKIINSILWQPKGPDGVRRARWCVVRDTYGHLETNVMADWFMWFPKTDKNYNLRTNTHKLQFDIPLPNGQVEKLYLEMIFRAVGDQSAEELFKGLNITGLWLNEMDTLHFDVFKYGFPRVGRYRPPGTPIGGWSGMIGDMNAPAEDNWTYNFNVNRDIGLSTAEMAAYQSQFGPNFKVSFHVQPGGLSAGAENLANLPRGYYERLQIGMSENDKRRFIHNKFGAVRNGNPVYGLYDDKVHCVPGLTVDPRYDVHIALDGGSTPAALFGQKVDSGQIRIVDEVVVFEPGKDKQLQSFGAMEFGQTCGRYWNENFKGCRLGDVHWADPSCWFGDSTKNKEDRAWIHKFVAGFNEVAIGAKIRFKAPCTDNLLTPRLEAVNKVLKGRIGTEPEYVISDKCRVLRQGFNQGYVTVRVQFSTGGGRWKDEPLKNDFSHVHDTNQYFVMGIGGWKGRRARDDAGARDRRSRGPKTKHGDGYFAHKRRA